MVGVGMVKLPWMAKVCRFLRTTNLLWRERHRPRLGLVQSKQQFQRHVGLHSLRSSNLIISSQQLNEIQWISADKTLVVGTLGQEFIIELEAAGGFGADNARATPQSHYGSSYHMPVRLGDELVFALASDDEVRALTFNERENAYVADPIQLLFDEYPKPEKTGRRRKFRQLAWDESRRTLWCVDTAGNLFGMTRDCRLNVTMWHTHELGGFDATVVGADQYAAGDNIYDLCAGSVMSVAVIPNPLLGVNDIWLTVKRVASGVLHYHIERIIGKGISSDTVDTAALFKSGNYYVDSCVYGANAIATGVPEDYKIHSPASDFTHLEGETVEGTADSIGAQGIFSLKPAVVTAGEVTVVAPYPPSYTTVSYNMAYGLPFSSIVEPVRLEAGSQIGSAQGAIKRIHKATVRFYRTLSAKIGASSEQVETLIFRTGSTAMGASPELFTGDKECDLEADYDRDGYIYLLQDKPLPFAVISIIAEGMTYD